MIGCVALKANSQLFLALDEAGRQSETKHMLSDPRRHRSRTVPLLIPVPVLSFPTVADAWRALKNPSIGESSIEGLTSVLSTSGSPTDGLSVMQGNYSETASFAALSGGTLSGGVLLGGKGKYSR